MRVLSSAAILLIATVAAAPAVAQTPASPQQRLSMLVRQDAALRDRIGRLQLDALISRVDQAIGHKPASTLRIAKSDALRRDLDRYTY